MNNMMKYQEALGKVSEVSNLLIGEAQNSFKVKSEEFMDEVRASQYIKVPLVGVFSAGKSSLLNIFTGKSGMLPVDTMPETAVAYELYYGTTETVELYRDGTKVDIKPLAEIKNLNTESGDIAKVYCTSEPIKRLQEKDIILVDMPGIGSGIKRHDDAISHYINSGTAFVLLVDAEQGSLRGSTLSFMQELSQYKMYPAVLVSKIDKKPEGDVKEIVDYIRFQMSKLGNEQPFVGTVCSVNNDLEGLNRYLSGLNPEALVAEKLGKKFKYLVGGVIEQLKMRIALRSKDIADVDEKIKQIDEEISNVKTELPTENCNADTPEKSTQDILDNVRFALEAKAGDIAQMIVNREDEETIKATILSIVRAEMISSFKDESDQYSSALGLAVQESMKDMEAIKLSPDFMSDFSPIIELFKGPILELLPVAAPWKMLLSALLPYLPNILSRLFGKNEQEAVEEVRGKVIELCVQQVLTSIQPMVLKITKENQQRIQKQIQEEVISKMEKVKAGLREKMADAHKNKEEVEAELTQLNAAISHLNAVVESV
ncbi:hypothetical protein EII14_05075 [Alloprevotella sp. OH1205_COT-284]|nr:hypothetical protein EII14_05075 [Alloprevotella sp. OH1205_COT-284]